MHCTDTSRNILAYLALGCIMASVVYLIAKACCLDSPFRKSLTPAQVNIMKASSGKRRTAFGGGVVVAVVVLALWRPF